MSASVTSGPNIALWLPCLLLAHAIAIFWILRTQVLARKQEKERTKAAKALEAQIRKQGTGNCSAWDGSVADPATAAPIALAAPAKPVFASTHRQLNQFCCFYCCRCGERCRRHQKSFRSGAGTAKRRSWHPSGAAVVCFRALPATEPKIYRRSRSSAGMRVIAPGNRIPHTGLAGTSAQQH